MRFNRLKKIVSLSILIFFYKIAISQKIQTISLGNEKDSSYYHLAKINDNEFWAGGEYGILTVFDSSGNMGSIKLPLNGAAIHKIERKENYVFLITDECTIIKYNLTDQTFIKSKFTGFRNKCFYDIIFTNDEKILLCGGTSGISKAEKKLPRGFIAITDLNLSQPKIIWKSFRKFVWSIKETTGNEFLAATFNGVNSKIIRSRNEIKWRQYKKIKGLVHEISLINNKVVYCGTGGIHFNKNGFIQKENGKKQVLKKEGCIWSMESVNEHPIAVTQKGKLLIGAKNDSFQHLKLPTNFPIYDLEQISENKFMVVGHGKSAFLVETP
jgi:hypothetical protein